MAAGANQESDPRCQTDEKRRPGRAKEVAMPEFDGRGFRLHYEECGDGEPVLLLPGYLMDHHLFDAQVARLSSRYRCISPDRRGHGRSDCPPGPWSMADLSKTSSR